MWRIPNISYRPEQKVKTMPRPNVNCLTRKKLHQRLIVWIKRKPQKDSIKKCWDGKWIKLDQTTLYEAGYKEWLTEPIFQKSSIITWRET